MSSYTSSRCYLAHMLAALALLSAGCAAAPPPAPLPVVRSPEEALSTARAFAAGGEYTIAERLLAAHTLPPPRTEGSAAMMNSRVLQLRAEIASQNAQTGEQSRRAEALAAWAVWEAPLTADAWVTYAEVRRRSTGYATLMAGIASREIQRYDGTDIGLPRVNARLPDLDNPASWLFLQALGHAVEGQTDAALATLQELQRIRRPCESEHLAALLHARTGNWDQLRRTIGGLEASANCADVRTSPSYQRARARLALAGRDRRTALEALREALRFDPSNPEAGAELARLEQPGVVMLATSLGNDHLYRVRANPFNWSAWTELWQASGMDSPLKGGAFLDFAEDVAQQHPSAVAPRLAMALARIRGGDFGGASLALGSLRAGGQASRELLECRLVLALALSDARTIRNAFDEFNRGGGAIPADASSGWDTVLRQAERPTEDVERQTAVARFLERAARRSDAGFFVRAGASAFVGGVLPQTPHGQAQALALLEGRTDLLGQGLVSLEGPG
jgi:tetratricopeptide (TPR) repeat protein